MTTILFISDDLRDKYAKLYLRKMGYEIIDYYIANKNIDYIVLPLNGVKQDQLFEYLVKENTNKIYIVYQINDYMLELKEKYKLKFLELKNDNMFTLINSISISEAVIKYSIEILPIVLKTANILILGYDNSSVELAKDYLHFSNKLLVAISKENIKEELDKIHVKNIDINELKEYIEGYDLIINTIPSLIIDEELLHYISPSSYILDISSSLNGVDYDKAKDYGVHAFPLTSLALEYAPKSCGIEYGKAIERGINN